jgi:hypothetical protein
MTNMKDFAFWLLTLTVFIPAIKAITYDCKGSRFCEDLLVGQCDERGDPDNCFTNGAAGETGTCSGHSGFFVQVAVCSFLGSGSIDAYNGLGANTYTICGSLPEWMLGCS